MTPNEASESRKGIREGLRGRLGWVLGARRREKIAEVSVNSYARHSQQFGGTSLESMVKADVKQECGSILTMIMFAVIWEIIKQHLFSNRTEAR